MLCKSCGKKLASENQRAQSIIFCKTCKELSLRKFPELPTPPPFFLSPRSRKQLEELKRKEAS